MKRNFKTSPHFQILARTLFAVVAVLALSAPHIFAGIVNATYNTGKEVPLTSNDFTAAGNSVNLALRYAPTPDTQLMVVRNTGSGIIKGTFSNLAQGQMVALSYAGVTYRFVVNYHGGKGNDLVLLWTNDDQSLPAATVKKLDPQILLALKQSRGQPPFDKPTTLQPNIPIRANGRALVDIEASISRELLDRVALLGGKVVDGSATATNFRAMVPISQLETLAGRTDVKSISPAILSVTSRIKVSPSR